MNRRRGFGLLIAAVLVQVVVVIIVVRNSGDRSGLVLATAIPLVALLTGIAKRLVGLRSRDLDAAIAADLAELDRCMTAAIRQAYPHALVQDTAAMAGGMYRKAIDSQAVAPDPEVVARLGLSIVGLASSVAASQALAHPDVIRARQVLAANLLRKQAAAHPVAFYSSPIRALFWLVVGSPLVTIPAVLGALGLGGLLGLGLADLYYGGHIVLKILALILASVVTMILSGVMRLFGLCELRGWVALCGFIGAVAVVSLHVAGMDHWPWWGGPLVGLLYIAAGLTAQPPSVYGAAALADPTKPPPPVSGVSIFPHPH